MRITWVLLLLAGCAGTPAGTNVTAEKAPQAPAPSDPGPTAQSYRPAIEANEAPFHVPGNVTAHLNEEVRIGDLRVKPLAILEDSRCPVDVTCVWAGRIRLRVAVSGAGEVVMELNQPVNVAGGDMQLTLEGAYPPNWAHPPAGIDPNEPKRFAFSLGVVD